ncbi:unnamed protein product [Caenorhabditis angaria]|uniref:PTHB1 N-terminal domain-containing protein n=1 Tax=Caenorhabditis angaria TaxID=860376 RepID=A0A9P1MUQ2_9PELO|nr:unnamed protein product [Caenorhabditis angaria]
MSLFRVIDWFTLTIPYASTMLEMEIYNDRHQIITGGEDGQIAVFDPGNEDQQNIHVLTYATYHPILQMEHGDFLASVPNVLAILSPDRLAYFKIQRDFSSTVNHYALIECFASIESTLASEKLELADYPTIIIEKPIE